MVYVYDKCLLQFCNDITKVFCFIAKSVAADSIEEHQKTKKVLPPPPTEDTPVSKKTRVKAIRLED